MVTASGFSGVIEREYLIRAGVGEVTLSSSGSEPFEHEARFHFDCSREIAAGAWRALRKIRLALDGG